METMSDLLHVMERLYFVYPCRIVQLDGQEKISVMQRMSYRVESTSYTSIQTRFVLSLIETHR